MDAVFLKILNMSITSCWLILAVIFVRLVFRKTPKWIICLLWGFAAVRLICPLSFESTFSLVPSSETIPHNIELYENPVIDSGITVINDTVNPVIAESFTPNPGDSANPLQIVIPAAAMVWIAGAIIMLAYALASWYRLKKTISASAAIGEGILICDDIRTPFILGVFKPVICLPSSLDEKTKEYVIRHEKAHLRRLDHWWKPFGYFLLSLHWFNPLCWIAYILMCRDIEMACDEKVIRDMDRQETAGYSQALLDCAYPSAVITACPLAFGESGIRQRIRGILNYRKPTLCIIAAGAAISIALALCLMTDPFSEKSLDGKLGVSMDMAVMEQNRSLYTEGHFATADYDVLKVSKFGEQAVVYALVMYEEFSYDGNDVILESGSFGPCAVTFDTASYDNDSSSYKVTEYWTPRDGSYFVNDINQKFPFSIRRKALDVSGSEAAHQKCLQEARVYFGVYAGNEMPDLSFLNYENAVSLAADMTDVQTVWYPPVKEGEPGMISPGYVRGPELAKYLDLVSWKKKTGKPSETLSSPGSIEFILSEDYRITVYQEPALAKVVFQEQERFYHTGKEDYENAVKLFDIQPAEKTVNMDTLRKKYPDYFDLPTENGLELYVWQASAESYSCGLVVKTDGPKVDPELRRLKGAAIEEMRAILSTYDISREMIELVPYQSMVSSYRYEIDDEYVERLETMLFGGMNVISKTAYANWSEDSRIMGNCLNPDTMILSSLRHLPAYRFTAVEELDAFREMFRDILTLDRGYDEVPSFNEVTAGYDEAFFRDHTLVLAYVSASSGSFRYALRDVTLTGHTLRLNVVRTNDPEVYTADMSGWFVMAEFLDTDLSEITEFDAALLHD